MTTKTIPRSAAKNLRKPTMSSEKVARILDNMARRILALEARVLDLEDANPSGLASRVAELEDRVP